MHFKDKMMPIAIPFNITCCRHSVCQHKLTCVSLVHVSHGSLILQGEFVCCLGFSQVFEAMSGFTASRYWSWYLQCWFSTRMLELVLVILQESTALFIGSCLCFSKYSAQLKQRTKSWISWHAFAILLWVLPAHFQCNILCKSEHKWWWGKRNAPV